MRTLRPMLIVVPSMALGGLLTATLTTTARAQDPVPTKVFEYRVAHSERELNEAGKEGFAIIDTKMAENLYMTWTMEKK